MAMVIMGLGNPGSEYEKTRHNAGRMVVERLAKEEGADFAFRKAANAHVAELSIEGEKLVLVLPEVYMNHSGKAVLPFVKSVKAAQKLLVVRDDLDMPLGTLKMTMFGRGSGGHKGVESIMRALKTKEFAQLKVGISGATAKGRVKKPGGEEKVIKHVIGKFKPAEEVLLKKTLKKAAEATRVFATDGIERAMLFANTH
ncbi:MAG TPA: aminoacyl-tRNA hydrolase [Candidatus Paceibacterota bacterium]|jgi:PTH1 family peptidyl-tRNA hydrolase